MSTISAYTAFALILAAILDYVLMLWLRKMTRRNRHYQPARDEAVYVFGIYSPVLTWLRYRKLPRPPDPAPTDDKPA